MSKQALEAIIGRALLDADFRAGLFANPEQALAECDLTDAEIAAVKLVDAETLEDMARTLMARLSARDRVRKGDSDSGLDSAIGMEDWPRGRLRGYRTVD